MSGPQNGCGPGSVGALPEAENYKHRILNSTALGPYRALIGHPHNGFADATRAMGLLVNEAVDDGSLHRAQVEGDRPGQKSGWYVLHGGASPAGAFGNWKTGESDTWRAVGEVYSPAERARFREALEQAKRIRAAAQAESQHAVALFASRQWWSAGLADARHPYLVAKGVRPHGIRQRNNFLLVPMRDTAGELWGFQTIAADGTKRFLRGARKRGLYHAIGGAVESVLAVAEGYATAASIHEATGYPVAVAFDAGNLEPVAKALRAKYQRARMIVCGDDDQATAARIGKNPGRFYAEQAARSVGASVALPEFAE